MRTMRATRGVAVLVAAVAALGACSDPAPEPEPSPAPVDTVVTSPVVSETASPTVAADAECENAAAVAADPIRRTNAPVRVDVDGDGIPENVLIALDPTAPVGCQAFLVVQILDVVYSASIWEAGPQSGLTEPSIHSFADINGEPGAEILVVEAAGASTQFVGAFVLTDTALERITFDGASDSSVPEAGDLFPYGGSVGHLEGVDCTDEGTIVVSSAVPGSTEEDLEGGVYNVERTFYRLEGEELHEESNTRDQVRIQRLEQFPEFAAGPFGSC